jgi:hypothetical protein
VWCENGDLVWSGEDKSEAAEELATVIAEHVTEHGCDGCGVLTPSDDHGFSIRICEGEYDVTEHVFD